jgi:hypothetical protein
MCEKYLTLPRHRPLDETEDLDFLFSVHDFRIITKTLQVHYDGKIYQTWVQGFSATDEEIQSFVCNTQD